MVCYQLTVVLILPKLLQLRAGVPIAQSPIVLVVGLQTRSAPPHYNYYKYSVSCEPEGRYHHSKMFHWEAEGGYHCTMSMAIVPFWFSVRTSLNSDSALLALNWWHSIFIIASTVVTSNSVDQWSCSHMRGRGWIPLSGSRLTKFGFSLYIVGWEPEGCYHNSRMFHWEPEGRYRHRPCTLLAPFWFSTEHDWIIIVPFWLSTDKLC